MAESKLLKLKRDMKRKFQSVKAHGKELRIRLNQNLIDYKKQNS